MIRNHIVYNPILEYKFGIKKAQGSLLWTKEGKRLIDFTSGWNTANLGWNNLEITEAIRNQLDRNTYAPSWTEDESQIQYAELLIKQLPKPLNTICRTTSGTESNEQAIKIARTTTGRKKILGFFDTYHGSTYASISIGYRNEYIENLLPVVGDFIHIDYPNVHEGVSEKKIQTDFLEKLDALLKHKDVAAVLTEAGMITGWGSMAVAPYGFLKDIKKLTETYGTLLILDEVGTGFSRCGRLFAHELEGVVPDILTLAKAMTNGTAAMGACITNTKLIADSIPKAKVLSSLAWQPIACAAAIASLQIHLKNRVWESALTHGLYMMRRLKKINKIIYVRGRGMEIGVDFVHGPSDAETFEFTSKVVRTCFENGLLVLQSDATTLQIMPPLTTPKKVLDEGLDILEATIDSL
jgi:4-aminobutyrate aminotransferase-like enzyme